MVVIENKKCFATRRAMEDCVLTAGVSLQVATSLYVKLSNNLRIWYIDPTSSAF